MVCDYGELNVAEFGPRELAINAKFCFDLKDFSPTAAPTAEHELVIWDLLAATAPDPHFLRLDLIRARFDLDGLINKKTVKSLTLEGGSLLFGKSLRAMFADSTGKPDRGWRTDIRPSFERRGWESVVRHDAWDLDIHRVAIRVEDERPEVSDITFALNTSLKNVPLSKSASSLGSESSWSKSPISISLHPRSVYQVLTLDSLFLRFTLAGLSSKGNRQPDDFGTDNLCRRGSLLGTWTTCRSGWGQPEGRLRSGMESQRAHRRLRPPHLGSGGRKQYGLPLGFRTRAADVALDNLAALKLQAVLEIRRSRLDSYQLEFTSEQGELRYRSMRPRGI
jgi:hypothetical protein